MTNIGVYDSSAKVLEDFAEANDTTIAEVVEKLILDYLDVLEM